MYDRRPCTLRGCASAELREPFERAKEQLAKSDRSFGTARPRSRKLYGVDPAANELLDGAAANAAIILRSVCDRLRECHVLEDVSR